MGWYKKCMPSVKDATDILTDIVPEISKIPGVKGIYVHGSYAKHINQPSFLLKDIDIIATTDFDIGDLLAIDNSKYSALRISRAFLEEEGFNPKAVDFTKQFLKFDIDHWATSSDGKLLHWGAIPDTQSDWEELHLDAEKRAEANTGIKRSSLRNQKEEKRKEWKHAYDDYIAHYLKSSATGWYPSEQSLESILQETRKLA